MIWDQFAPSSSSPSPSGFPSHARPTVGSCFQPQILHVSPFILFQSQDVNQASGRRRLMTQGTMRRGDRNTHYHDAKFDGLVIGCHSDSATFAAKTFLPWSKKRSNRGDRLSGNEKSINNWQILLSPLCSVNPSINIKRKQRTDVKTSAAGSSSLSGFHLWEGDW